MLSAGPIKAFTHKDYEIELGTIHITQVISDALAAIQRGYQVKFDKEIWAQINSLKLKTEIRYSNVKSEIEEIEKSGKVIRALPPPPPRRQSEKPIPPPPVVIYSRVRGGSDKSYDKKEKEDILPPPPPPPLSLPPRLPPRPKTPR